MAIGKWWLKHGPGSPGSIAQAMADAFRDIRTRSPELGLEQLLHETLESRYRLVPLADAREQESMLKEAGGSLIKLVLLVVEREHYQVLVEAPVEVYLLVFDVVLEVLGERAPEQIKRELQQAPAAAIRGGVHYFRTFWGSRPVHL